MQKVDIHANTETKSRHPWREWRSNLHCSQKHCNKRMVPDYGYAVQASYMLYLFFIFSLLSYRYRIIIIYMIKKLELHVFMVLRLNEDWLLANPNLCAQNRYIDVENNLHWILMILSYLVYALLKIAHFTALKRWGKNQKGRSRLDERFMCFLTYLLWPSMRTHLL